MPASRLCLEITESAIMIDPTHAAETVRRLHEFGVRIAIDDFGMGYSSLSYLSSLPVDEIKIDKSFVFGILDNHHDEVITRAVIDMGHNLSVRVVAEGVENEETYAKLKEMGCDMAQGYLMCRPVPADELLAYVRKIRAGQDSVLTPE